MKPVEALNRKLKPPSLRTMRGRAGAMERGADVDG